MKTRALKFVRFDRIEDHFRLGWVMSFPNAPMHHHYYGCELAWICSCPVPGGFGRPKSKRDKSHTIRGTNERARA